MHELRRNPSANNSSIAAAAAAPAVIIPAPAPGSVAPKVGFVSLGCPKALVDSERILTKLRADGYEISATYDGADVVIVNTCGFLDSAKRESLDAIGEALDENGRHIWFRQSALVVWSRCRRKTGH